MSKNEGGKKEADVDYLLKIVVQRKGLSWSEASALFPESEWRCHLEVLLKLYTRRSYVVFQIKLAELKQSYYVTW